MVTVVSHLEILEFLRVTKVVLREKLDFLMGIS